MASHRVLSLMRPAPLPSSISPCDPDCSRRAFVTSSAVSLLAAALASCGGDRIMQPSDGAPPSTPPRPPVGSVTYVNGVLTISLDAAPALAAPNGFLVSGASDPSRGRADVIVLNLGDEGFRAFSSICTHEGCTVTDFSTGRIRCPCHGSEFDQHGVPVLGPAPRALREYRVTFDANARTVAVTIA